MDNMKKYSNTQGCQMHIAVGKQRIESLYRTDSEIELKEQMIKNNEAKYSTSKQIKITYSFH